jgi:prophage antirepressor-like protein
MNFFLDIFNQLLKINKNEIIIIFNINGDVWFGLKDIIKALGYKSLLNTYRMKIPNKFISKINNIEVSPSMGIMNNFQYNTKLINEQGLYQILSNSTKPLAKLFMDKYINEIMPQTSTLKGYENWPIHTRY